MAGPKLLRHAAVDEKAVMRSCPDIIIRRDETKNNKIYRIINDKIVSIVISSTFLSFTLIDI